MRWPRTFYSNLKEYYYTYNYGITVLYKAVFIERAVPRVRATRGATALPILYGIRYTVVYSMVNRTVPRMHSRCTVHPTTHNTFQSPHVLYTILCFHAIWDGC